MGHTAGESRSLPQRCRGRGAITTLRVERCRCSRAVRGVTMSEPSSTTYRFNTRNKRSGRLRIEAGRTRTGIEVFVMPGLIDYETHATKYAVDGLDVGKQ